MLKKVLMIGFSLYLLMLLQGCVNELPLHLSKEENPPSLTLTVGEQVIETFRGGYSWSTKNILTGETMTTMTDAAAPPQIVQNKEGPPINKNDGAHLHFEKEPSSYEINIWDSENVVASYSSFDEIEEKGNTIIEIVGHWEQGRATYVTIINIQ